MLHKLKEVHTFKGGAEKKEKKKKPTSFMQQQACFTHRALHSVTPIVTSCVSGTLNLTAERGGSPFHWVILYTSSQHNTKEQRHKGKPSESITCSTLGASHGL